MAWIVASAVSSGHWWNRCTFVIVTLHFLRYVGLIDNGGGEVFVQLTEELLDLSVSVKGRNAGAFAMLLACCCCSSCCFTAGAGD
jgi:hypothetical protein